MRGARLFAASVLACLACVGCASATHDASAPPAPVSIVAAPSLASKNPTATGVEQWVPFDIQADTSEFVAFVGYEAGASDADRTIPAKGKYAILWRNGDKNVTIGWADPTQQEPLQLSVEQLRAMGEDLKAISSEQSSSLASSPGAEGALEPQGLVAGALSLLRPCHAARLIAAGDTVVTALAGVGTLAACTGGEAFTAGLDTPICIAGITATAAGASMTALAYDGVASACQYQYR
jgi:hypothetical protein